MNNQSATVPGSVLKNLQLVETLLLLSASVILQFVIHLIPPVNGTPIGAIFLPVFIAPMIAIVLFKPHVALIAGVFAPVVNYLVTGSPKPEMLTTLTFELLIFVSVAVLLHRSGKTKEFTALVAIVAAKALSFFIMPLLGNSIISVDTIVRTFIMAVPGILVLFFINKLLLRYKGE